MVLTTKRARDLIKTSGLANKKAKNSYKGHKKDNYKKKQKTMNECCICYEKVEVCKDNTITCNTKDHVICLACKFKMKGHKGFLPFSAGKSLLLDVGNTHAVYNNSSEDRDHIIVHGKITKQFKELVEYSYEKNGSK